MEPLSPNDPLWKLLGQAKPVNPRPNFTQNVLRAARQTPQETGWLSRLRGWVEQNPVVTPVRGALAAGALAALAILIIAQPWAQPQRATLAQTKVTAAEVATADTDFPAAPEVTTQWENMEKFDSLLAVEDTSELTDREIHLLLY